MSCLRSFGSSFPLYSFFSFSFPVLRHAHLIAAEFDVLDHLLEVLHLAIIDLDSLTKRARMASCMRHLCCPLTMRHFARRLALA